MARGESGENVAFALGLVVALLLAGVYFWQLRGQLPAAGDPAQPLAAAPVPAGAAASGVVGATAADNPGAPAQLLFDAGSDRLPAASLDVLARMADEARAHGGATVEVSGFYPSGGDATAEADLATRRVRAARHALEANGVPSAQLRGGVGMAPAGTDERMARRVEVAIR